MKKYRYKNNLKGLLLSKNSNAGKIVFSLVFFIFLCAESFAPPPPPPPPSIPVDGGIGWLIAAGIAYGARKTYEIGKKKK